MTKKREITRRMIEVLNKTECNPMTEEEKVRATNYILGEMEKDGWVWDKGDEKLLRSMRTAKGRRETENYFRGKK